MANTERLEKLKSILIKSNGVGIKELSKELGVTEMTVRRDLKSLMETGDAVIVRGVAVYRPKAVSVEAQVYSIEDEKKVMREEKARIGKKAAEMLEVGDVIFLDVCIIAGLIYACYRTISKEEADILSGNKLFNKEMGDNI